MKARMLACLVIAAGLLGVPGRGLADAPAALSQTPDLVYNEARTVYLGNLQRRANGVPPLRWNAQLTDAARWYAWDSTENRPPGFCGHQDTQGRWPVDRLAAFGYKGSGGAENAFCGYLSPEDAITGWMNSPGHRANLLDPNSREIGLGYYRRASDGRGYVTQDFGRDVVYPPVVIENEAITTTASSVNLYIYDRETSGSFAAMSPAREMMVANDACFTGGVWEPYSAARAWTLAAGGDGWRTVYVKTRDVFSRTATVSDTIYFGASAPLNELGAAQMSGAQPQVTLNGLNGGGLPQAEFSPGWLVDDTSGSLSLLWGTGERVNDSAAWGGTAFRLGPPGNYTESSAWVYTTDFVRDVPLVAYVRLKVASNASPDKVARFSATGGGALSLKGTDFSAPNQYQEFPLAFIFPPGEAFLTFQFWRSGATDVYVDVVTIFTSPQSFASTTSWAVPGGNYRGQGVWVRYINGGSQFTGIIDASVAPPPLSVYPPSLVFMAARAGSPPPPVTLNVTRGCPSISLLASSDAGWLQATAQTDTVRLTMSQAGLSNGTYPGAVTVQANGVAGVPPVSVPVTLIVVDRVYSTYLPGVSK